MAILSNDKFIDIIAWLPHGRGFMIHKKEAFSTNVLPQFFPKESKFASFTRRLSRWGFRRIRSGLEIGVYHHPLFKKGNYELCLQMHCVSKSLKDDLADPSFYMEDDHNLYITSDENPSKALARQVNDIRNNKRLKEEKEQYSSYPHKVNSSGITRPGSEKDKMINSLLHQSGNPLAGGVGGGPASAALNNRSYVLDMPPSSIMGSSLQIGRQGPIPQQLQMSGFLPTPSTMMNGAAPTSMMYYPHDAPLAVAPQHQRSMTSAYNHPMTAPRTATGTGAPIQQFPQPLPPKHLMTLPPYHPHQPPAQMYQYPFPSRAGTNTPYQHANSNTMKNMTNQGNSTIFPNAHSCQLPAAQVLNTTVPIPPQHQLNTHHQQPTSMMGVPQTTQFYHPHPSSAAANIVPMQPIHTTLQQQQQGTYTGPIANPDNYALHPRMAVPPTINPNSNTTMSGQTAYTATGSTMTRGGANVHIVTGSSAPSQAVSNNALPSNMTETSNTSTSPTSVNPGLMTNAIANTSYPSMSMTSTMPPATSMDTTYPGMMMKLPSALTNAGTRSDIIGKECIMMGGSSSRPSSSTTASTIAAPLPPSPPPTYTNSNFMKLSSSMFNTNTSTDTNNNNNKRTRLDVKPEEKVLEEGLKAKNVTTSKTNADTEKELHISSLPQKKLRTDDHHHREEKEAEVKGGESSSSSSTPTTNNQKGGD